jgi:nucleotide-binding universal stress UspA family protein
MSWPGPIVVPLDGSELAERAVPVAAELARRARAEVRLVHVHVPLAAEPIYVEGLPVIDEHMRSLRREHEQAYLDRALERLAGGIAASAAILEGPVAEAVASYARNQGAALIVMTTHGRGAFERAWLGSVAEELTRVSPVPLLLIRPGAEAVTGAFGRILVPLDGSPLAEAVLEHAVRLARLEARAELILLEVVQPLTAAVWVADPALAAPLAAPEMVRRGEEEARKYLDAVAHRLEAEGVRVHARVEVAANVALAILEAARREQADLVALATHGRTGLVRLALGSIADKVLRGSPTPVLLFRPPKPAAPANR